MKSEHIDHLLEESTKLLVASDLYDELKASKVSTHEEYIITLTKIRFLREDILSTCENILKVTRQREKVAQHHL